MRFALRSMRDDDIGVCAEQDVRALRRPHAVDVVGAGLEHFLEHAERRPVAVHDLQADELEAVVLALLQLAAAPTRAPAAARSETSRRGAVAEALEREVEVAAGLARRRSR